jgi:hypothetical protein
VLCWSPLIYIIYKCCAFCGFKTGIRLQQRISKSTKLPDLSLAHTPTIFLQGLDQHSVVIILLGRVLNSISYWRREHESELILDITSITLLATLCIGSDDNGSLESCPIGVIYNLHPGAAILEA